MGTSRLHYNTTTDKYFLFEENRPLSDYRGSVWADMIIRILAPTLSIIELKSLFDFNLLERRNTK